jgi:hypothetical protein
MAFNFGQVNDFSDSNSLLPPVILALGKAIPMPRFKGAVFQAARPPMISIKTKEIDIYSRSKTARSGVIGTAAAGDWGGTSAVAALPIPAASIAGLQIGMVIQVDSEVVVLSAVDKAANTVGVFARGAGGTTAAVHASSAAFTVLGTAIRDVDLKNVTAIQESTLKYVNYVQLVAELLDWTKGAELQRQGLSEANVIAVLQQEAAIRVAEILSVMAVRGVKQLGTGSIPYMSAGLLAQLEDTSGSTRPILRANASSVALSETILKGALDTVFLTGNPDTIVCNLTNANKFTGFVGAGKDVTVVTGRDDNGAGRWVDHYDYNGVRLGILVDADMPTDRVAVVTLNDIQVGWLDGDALRTVSEPTQSSREKRESIQGSVGFAVENVGYDHIEIYGLV